MCILHFPGEALHEKNGNDLSKIVDRILLFFWLLLFFIIPKAQANWTGKHEKDLDRKLLYSQILKIYEKRMDFKKVTIYCILETKRFV